MLAAGAAPTRGESQGARVDGGVRAARGGRPRFLRDRSTRVVPVERLDASQRRAVRARGSLVRAFGAPGTGKTTVAVHAVLDRVRSGEVRPHETLVLAPTRVAAARLRHGLTAELAATTASPLVCSVQAFAFGLLRRDAAERGEPTPRLLSGPEQDVVLRELLAGHESGFGRRPDWPAALAEATRTRGFRAELRDLLMRAVEYGLDAEGFAALAAREGNDVWGAAAQVLAEYDEVTALSSPGGYDPAWILTAAADLLEDDPAVRARVHDEVRVVVVDDAQELTAPAARLLALLRSPVGEVVLVGDPDVATQTFRGADPRLMMSEPATVTCVLERSWRLPARVGEVVSRVAERVGSVGSVAHRLGRPLGDGGVVGLVSPPSSPGSAPLPADAGGSDAATGVAAGTEAPGHDGGVAARRSVTSLAAARGRANAARTSVPEQATLFDWSDDADADADAVTGPAGPADGAPVTPPTDRAGEGGAPVGPGGSVGSVGSGVPSADISATSAGPPGDSAHASPDPATATDVGPSPNATAEGETPTEGDVEVAVLATAVAEARYVAARLRQAHLVDGMPYSRMAVVVRGAGRSATMRRVLAGDGIPVDVPGARVPLREEPAVRPLLTSFAIALARATAGATDDGARPPAVAGAGETGLDAETVLDLLASPLGGSDSLAVRRLLRALRQAEVRRLESESVLPEGSDPASSAPAPQSVTTSASDLGGPAATSSDTSSGTTSTVCSPLEGGAVPHAGADEPAGPGASATGDAEFRAPRSATPHADARTSAADPSASAAPFPFVVPPRIRSTDELLVAAVTGDPVIDHVDAQAPAAGLRRIRRVLAAGVAAASRHHDGWAPGVTAETVLWAMWEAGGLAEPWRRAALAGSQRADRDLDAVVALMDAAARYVDRLPLRGPDGFLEHVRGQDVAGDTLVARAPADECVTLTTPAGAAGSEWDLVVVAGLQEGVWPDLRLRGSVLGSAALVDTLTGRGLTPQGARSAIRSDETRLLLVAVSRTRDRLLCTAVRNDEETPSPFLDLVDPLEEARPFATPPPPMTASDLVATLRRRVTGGALATLPTPASAGERPDAADAHEPPREVARPADRVAARLLARLADSGVAGADPDDWWGLRDVSDDRPRRADDDRVAVSPSKVEAFARCELRWLLAGSGGQAGEGTVASTIGTLVHDIAATTDNGDHAALLAELERRWPELDLPPGWLSRRRHEEAVAMIDRLHRQHRAALAAGWEVVGTEIDVEVPLGRAVVRGRVDRLERDAEGRLRVVDLKTGSSKPPAADLPTHPQLGAYQVAVEEGAFAEHGTDSAGAALMQIGRGGGVRGALQEQQPLAAQEDPGWARELLDSTAEGMAGATFRANAGAWCRVCESRFSCPIQPEGEMLR
ncbi:hypothetical protein MOPEL_073_00510 [Mobilicoccus pelagius NBRC 104925]|uniref:DNA 3'-5' helicase n=1 Tax=Mobilicoccus pelagius NBRC 104925 TaxID=1089455 RepID=H5URQ3_9MICO|nr:hypothetical protein MOPEL_073_00510 [Mobilicoccus pelagius NBRC 104925]